MEMSWQGWGDPARVTTLPDGVRELLRQALGVESAGPPRPDLAALALPPARLTDAALTRMSGIVGEEHVHRDDEARVRHTRGKSTPDLLRLRLFDLGGAPDAVLTPGSHEEIIALLALCSELRVAVVPFGGGTSVVGGLEADGRGLAGVIALDTRRLNGLLALDEVSRVAELGPGLRGPEAEALLAEHGFTLGHFPQSFLYASLGGFAAARSSGQASAGYGRFDEMVVGLRLATPRGTLELGRAPRSAAGPDLRQLVLGSEGSLGVITSLRLAIRPVPRLRRYEAWRFETFRRGTSAVRSLAQDGPRPTVLRLSDEVETALNLASPGELGSGGAGSLMVAGWENEVGDLSPLGGEPVAGAGEAWEHGRYDGPYLRDALLDAGALVETLETATFWSGLEGLYDGVREALTTSLGRAVVLCHISHVYATGASLYFTVAAAQGEDPLGRWADAKRAASEAILRAGATITHHHGVGRDHAEAYATEVGALGVAALRAVKRELDPAGIMNPGVLGL